MFHVVVFFFFFTFQVHAVEHLLLPLLVVIVRHSFFFSLIVRHSCLYAAVQRSYTTVNYSALFRLSKSWQYYMQKKKSFTVVGVAMIILLLLRSIHAHDLHRFLGVHIVQSYKNYAY